MVHTVERYAVPRFEREAENYVSNEDDPLWYTLWKDMLYPDLKEKQKIMSQRVAETRCACNKNCSNQSEHFLIQ